MNLFRSLLQRLFGKSAPVRRARPTFRPGLEAFEGRIVPTTVAIGNPLASAATKATVRIVSVWDTNHNHRIDAPVLNAAGHQIGGDRWEQGSGAMITRNDVLTAGHVLFKNAREGGLGRATWSMVYAAQNNPFERPFGEARGIAWYTPTAWRANNGNFDMGILRLDRNLGLHTGTFHYGWLDSRYFQNGLPLTLRHYPGHLHHGFVQYSSTGQSQRGTNPTEVIYYRQADIQTSGGSSGGPLIVQNVRLDNGYWGNVPTIIGVHARGWAGARPNEATRITPYLFAWIQSTVRQGPNLVDRADLMDYDFWFQRTTSRLSSLRVGRGGSLTITASIWNGGTAAPGGNLTIRFFASQDRNIGSAGDTLLGTLVLRTTSPLFRQLRPFNNQQPARLPLRVTIPARLTPGRYFIGWIIDPGRALQDYDRTNNAGLFNGGLLQVQ